MNEITFVINGEPRGKERARTFIQRGRLVTTTPEKTRNYEEKVAWSYKSQCKGIYFTGELEVIINAYYEIPKSWSKKKKRAAVDGLIRPNVTPDCDNIAKSVLDSLNEIAYKDDKAIQDLHIHKYYSDNPRCEITIIGEWLRV